MKILQTIKYFEPSKGGMESVAKNLVMGIKKSNPHDQIVVVCNNHEKSNQNIIDHIIDVTVVRYKSFFFKSQPLSLLFGGLKRYIQNTEVLHHHYPFPTMEIALLRHLKLLKRKKFVITWHANIENSRWSWIEKFYNPIISKLLNASSKIIVTSPQLFEHSTILKKFADKVEVIPLSFEAHQDVITAKELSRKPQILFVGKLRLYKGLIYLIKAVQDLDVKVNIIGNGELEADLIKYIREHNLQNKIFLHNDVTDEKLKSFYKKSDFFVLPSINEAEAFGVVQLEALSYGLPVINTSLKSGVPFVSLHDITGYTVKPADVTELKAAILKMISDPLRFSQFSSNALVRSKEFTNEKMVQKYLNIYAN